MKLGVVKRILKENLAAAGEVPPWVELLLVPLNQFIEAVGSALTNKLTFADNFSCVVYSGKFKHATELVINPKSSLKVSGVIPTYASSGQIITGFGFNRRNDGTIGVTLQFAAGAGTEATCSLVILLG